MERKWQTAKKGIFIVEKSMKKSIIFYSLCFIMICPKIIFSQISFRIYGGGGWIDCGDLNKNIQGWKNYFNDRDKSPDLFKYNVEELHGFWDGGLELSYSFSSRFQAALGLEFLTGKTKGNATSRIWREQNYFYSATDFGTISISEKILKKPEYRIQTIPVVLTLYYSFPLGTRWNFFLGCGGGYYSSKLTYKEGYQYNFDYKDEKIFYGSLMEFVDVYSSSGNYSEEISSKTFGFHLKTGLELEIRRGLHFIIEAFGRQANFNDWKGDKKDSYNWTHTWGFWGIYSDKGHFEEVKKGKLWKVEFQSDDTGKSYPQLVLSEEKPLNASYYNAQQARINLNGFSLRIGIRVSL